MSWRHYNKETGGYENCVTLPSELEDFHVVMKDETWYNAIRNPYNCKQRVNKFLDGLKDLLDTLAEEEPEISNHSLYILHIDLAPSKKAAIVAIQRTFCYEFICKNVIIPFT